jgi:hypothetical protein
VVAADGADGQALLLLQLALFNMELLVQGMHSMV